MPHLIRNAGAWKRSKSTAGCNGTVQSSDYSDHYFTLSLIVPHVLISRLSTDPTSPVTSLSHIHSCTLSQSSWDSQKLVCHSQSHTYHKIQTADIWEPVIPTLTGIRNSHPQGSVGTLSCRWITPCSSGSWAGQGWLMSGWCPSFEEQHSCRIPQVP